MQGTLEDLSYNHTCVAKPTFYLWEMHGVDLNPHLQNKKTVFLLRTYVYLWVVEEGDKENLRGVIQSNQPYASGI